MQGRALSSTPAVETARMRRRRSVLANGRCARSGCATSEEAMTTFDKREEGFEKQFAHD
jgi:hypothetical protein